MNDQARRRGAEARDGCVEACRRCLGLVALITRTEPGVARAAWREIGPHLRHCLDHFACFSSGLDCGTVDYDARRRDPAVERDVERAARALDVLVGELEALDASVLAGSIEVRQAVSSGSAPLLMESTIERELAFLSSHTIHHLAIMAMAARAHGLVVPESVTLAFSTASYIAEQEA